MRRNTVAEDVKTLGLVLRRTNYGEADRILNLITPVGKIAAIAKGVRRAKSKLAGGVEMFCLSEFVVHRGRSELGVVTSARMVRSYGGILKDYERVELAGLILKKVNTAAEQVDSPEWFELVRQSLEALNNGTNVAIVKSWFYLNLRRMSGEEMNLYLDGEGLRLVEGVRYDWDEYEGHFVKNEQGEYCSDEIKLLRLMSGMDLATIGRIKIEPETLEKVCGIIRVWEN